MAAVILLLIAGDICMTEINTKKFAPFCFRRRRNGYIYYTKEQASNFDEIFKHPFSVRRHDRLGMKLHYA